MYKTSVAGNQIYNLKSEWAQSFLPGYFENAPNFVNLLLLCETTVWLEKTTRIPALAWHPKRPVSSRQYDFFICNVEMWAGSRQPLCHSTHINHAKHWSLLLQGIFNIGKKLVSFFMFSSKMAQLGACRNRLIQGLFHIYLQYVLQWNDEILLYY